MILAMPKKGQSKKRRHETLLSYWDEARGERVMPRENEIDLKEEPELWQHCFLLKVDPQRGYRYSYLGKALLEAYGFDPDSEEARQRLVDTDSMQMKEVFDQVQKSGKPQVVAGEFSNRHGVDVRYRSCVLPLAGEEPGKAAYILGTMDWKNY